MLRVLIVTAAALLFSTNMLGQEKQKMSISFHCQCDDQVGRQYATYFRDALAQSPRYEEAHSDQTKDLNGKVTSAVFVVSIVSVDESSTNPGKSSSFSLVLTLGGDSFISQYVQNCGINAVKNCASDGLSFVDGKIQGWLGS